MAERLQKNSKAQRKKRPQGKNSVVRTSTKTIRSFKENMRKAPKKNKPKHPKKTAEASTKTSRSLKQLAEASKKQAGTQTKQAKASHKTSRSLKHYMPAVLLRPLLSSMPDIMRLTASWGSGLSAMLRCSRFMSFTSAYLLVAVVAMTQALRRRGLTPKKGVFEFSRFVPQTAA